MTHNDLSRPARPRYSWMHATSVAVAVISGTLAMVAMLHSPQFFGLTLAVCAVGWIATDIVERLSAQNRASRAHAAPSTNGYAPKARQGYPRRRSLASPYTISLS